jgi:CheY-like chemotaxis protein
VVYQDGDVRQHRCDLVADEGYTIETVGNGRQPLDVLARSGGPCLMQLDMVMLGMDGPELIVRLCPEPDVATRWVIAVSEAWTAEPPRPSGNEAHGSAGAHPQDESGPSGFSGSILIVDDDDAIRDSLAMLLEDEGYRVHTAANGRAALALLECIQLPALAFIDLRMPVMDGVELIEAMRNDARLARLPVVVLSAASTVAAPEGLLILRKPIGIELILDAVRKLSAR